MQQELKTNSCGGYKHCKSRTCDPANKDCRECLDDSSKAIEKELEV